MPKLVELQEGYIFQVGGKAENLRRLIYAGFNVPSKGFVLTVDDLKNWENIRDVLIAGGKRARLVIQPTVKRAQELMGVASYY